MTRLCTVRQDTDLAKRQSHCPGVSDRYELNQIMRLVIRLKAFVGRARWPCCQLLN